ncbi:MAG TPA: cyclic nucleotide-binding domain-containing protein [Gemmataceae bacterium]|nr:cyclic nucleotide-binding domain-containing protein [Gemmataceae bacterium]
MTEQTTMSSHPFLNGLGEQYRTLLSSEARPFTATPGELLAREGEPAKKYFLIQAGHVALDLHAPGRGVVSIQTVGPGEVVGWSWLVPPNRWQFDCRAVDSVGGLVLDADWLRQKCEQDHELGYHLLKELVKVIGNRLAATRVQLLDIYK